MNNSNTANMAMGSVIDEKKDEVILAVVKCKECGWRHGGFIADTVFMSWRCKDCRKNNACCVSNGKVEKRVSRLDEIKYADFIKMHSLT